MLAGRFRSLLAMLMLTVLGGVLAWTSAAPLRQLLDRDSLDFPTALTGCSACLAWLLLAWFTGGVALTVLARLPGAAGRCAGRAADSITPAVLRRTVEAAIGASIVLGSTGQLAYAGTHAHASVAATGSAVIGSQDLPLPDRPASRGTRSPKPDRPGGEGDHHDVHGEHVVVVRPGDTLWDIAAAHLSGTRINQRIAATWPRWYAANRAVVGPDPNLILPGQRLRPPTPR